MPSISMGGSQKQFYRALTGNSQYAPDADTIGSRTNEAAGDTTTNGLNAQLDAVVQGSGEGWIVPNNKNVMVIFTGWTNAVIKIEAYFGIGSGGWQPIMTIEEPLKCQNLNFSCPYPIRIGVPAASIGADAATLKMWIGYADEGLNV